MIFRYLSLCAFVLAGSFSLANGQTPSKSSFLQKLENPRTRDSRVLSDQDFPTKFFSHSPTDRDDGRTIQRKFTGTSADAISTK